MININRRPLILAGIELRESTQASQLREINSIVSYIKMRWRVSRSWPAMIPNAKLSYSAASCALIKCSAQYEVGTDEYIYWAGIEALGSKPEYQQDREWLANQTNGELIYTAGNGLPVTKNLFNYGWTDATTDWGSRNLVGPRVAGGLQTAGGIAQIIGGVEACVSLVGCIAAPFLVFSGYDTGKAGLDQLFTGKRQNTWGGTALQGLGFEAETAELLYGMTQLAPREGLNNEA
ncbi:hypothetical protein NDY24_20595 [Xanthomonas hortorum pv. pelargonii]|nr:hypothetical protein NDY24_20595 [Xanthomonas hortorum pv. pelargonii]